MSPLSLTLFDILLLVSILVLAWTALTSADDRRSVILRGPLDGDTPQTQPRYHHVGLTQPYLFHVASFYANCLCLIMIF